MAVYYVYNLMYGKKCSKTLEFIQEYFLKIVPAVGSKSRAARVGCRQQKVRKLIERISNHIFEEKSAAQA